MKKVTYKIYYSTSECGKYLEFSEKCLDKDEENYFDERIATLCRSLSKVAKVTLIIKEESYECKSLYKYL